MQVFEGGAGRTVPRLTHRRRVTEKRITYVGLDVPKDTIALSLADRARRSARARQACEHSDGVEDVGCEVGSSRGGVAVGAVVGAAENSAAQSTTYPPGHIASTPY
jgi:hypothetical protein